MNLENKINEKANYALEAIENAINEQDQQVNRYLLPRIKEIVLEIGGGNYINLHELKGIVISNTPEGSGPDNDIFLLDVKGGNIQIPLQIFLGNLITQVEEYQQTEN